MGRRQREEQGRRKEREQTVEAHEFHKENALNERERK